MMIQISLKSRILSLCTMLFFVSGCSDLLEDFAEAEEEVVELFEQEEPLTAEQKLAIVKGVAVNTGVLKGLSKTSPLYLEAVKEQEDTDELVESLKPVICKKGNLRPKEGGYKCVTLGMKGEDVTEIWLLGNQGERLLKSNSYDFSKYTKLKVIHVNLGKSPATKINIVEVRNNKKLENFIFINQNLKALTFSKSASLKKLIVSGNELVSLDLSPYKFLNEVDLSNNSIDRIRIEDLKYLTHLDISGNRLISIKTTNLPSLKKVDVSDNELTELNLDGSPLLTHLGADQNRLRKVDLSNHTKLSVLEMHKNALSEIDLDSLYSLTYLDVSRNILKSLNIVHLKKLQQVNAGDNPLKTLEVSNLPTLKKLNAEMAGLQSLWLHSLPELQELVLSHNDLTNINVQELKSLEKLNIYQNKLGIDKPHYEIDLRHLSFLQDVDVRENPNLDALLITINQERTVKFKVDSPENIIAK